MENASENDYDAVFAGSFIINGNFGSNAQIFPVATSPHVADKTGLGIAIAKIEDNSKFSSAFPVSDWGSSVAFEIRQGYKPESTKQPASWHTLNPNEVSTATNTLGQVANLSGTDIQVYNYILAGTDNSEFYPHLVANSMLPEPFEVSDLGFIIL